MSDGKMYEDHVWRYVCLRCGHAEYTERRKPNADCPKCTISGRSYSGHLGQ